MAKIRAFSGLRYDTAKAGPAGDLLAPPYDVIDDAHRASLAAASPHNCVHVILPEAPAGSDDPLAKYRAGAAAFARLQAEALTRDPEPGFYVYHQRFESEGSTYVRKGFIGLIELTRFGHGPVLPHERTLAGPKQDRLELMRACDAHLELVFGLFADPERNWEAAVGPALAKPDLDVDWDGVHHSLWRVSDPSACSALEQVLDGKNIYIADGHHRYETMCSFRDELEAAGRGDAASWGMVYLSNLNDDGLVVLPTHRLVHDLASGVDLPALLADLAQWFDVRSVAMPDDASALRQLLGDAGAQRAAFGLAIPGADALTVLTLRADFDPRSAGLGQLPAALQRLDVALLHELLLERGLGITKQAQAAKTNLGYEKSTDAALARARGEAPGDDTQLVCFMNATPVHDVVAVCDSGEVMPQKSTFFFPKIPTGLVFRPIGDAS